MSSRHPTPPSKRSAPGKGKADASADSLASKPGSASEKAAASKAAAAKAAADKASGEQASRSAASSKAAAKVSAAQEAADRAAALALRGLHKEYGDLPALAPLDLRIAKGEAVVLIGHNGSGKTTMLRMCAGLLESSGGTALIGGSEAGSLEARAQLSYLSDTPTFYDDLSVWEHLELTARLHGRDDWEQLGADLLGLLGIYERADDLPVTFSRGLKQKTAIAMGFVRPFDLLLVDEPFVGLDASGKEALLELLDEAHERGAALVVATHELAFVERVERCLALRDGGLVYDGPTSGIDVLSLVS